MKNGVMDQIERLRRFIAKRSFKAGDFTLSSGAASDCFFDMKLTMMDPAGANMIADVFLDRIADEDADHVGGVAVGAVAVAGAICIKSERTDRPRQGFFVRKEAKPHGMRKQIEGNCPPEGAEALLFEDVTTTGKSAMVAVNALRAVGCTVKTLYTIVDRKQGAAENLAANGIRLVALFDRDDFKP